MTISSGFFATTPETEYTEPQFISYFDMMRTNGVIKQSSLTNVAFDAGSELEVTAQAVPDLSVLVGTGRAMINGYWIYNDAPYTVSISANTSGSTRIDRIVAHLDTSTDVITIIAIEGTPAGSPAAPALTRSGSVYELSLAQVEIPCGDSAIQNTQITDERSSVSLCGYASSIVQINEDFDVSGNKIINLATPIADTDATTKGYVDTLVGATILNYIQDNSGNLWLVQNAVYNSSTDAWTQPDTTKSSTGAVLSISGGIASYTCAAGNASITWTLYPSIDTIETKSTQTVTPKVLFNISGSSESYSTSFTVTSAHVPATTMYKKSRVTITVSHSCYQHVGSSTMSITNAITSTTLSLGSAKEGTTTVECNIGLGDVINFSTTGNIGYYPANYTFNVTKIGNVISPSADLSAASTTIATLQSFLGNTNMIPTSIGDTQELYSFHCTYEGMTYAGNEVSLLYPRYGVGDSYQMVPNPSATIDNLVYSEPTIYYHTKL